MPGEKHRVNADEEDGHLLPEHEGDGGEEGDDSTKGDVAPRS